MNLSENIKESWEDTSTQPPVPHAELLNLQELAEAVNSFDLDQITNIFNENDIKFDSIQQTLEVIAEINKTSPAGLYAILKIPSVASGKGQSQGGSGGARGTGIGRKTVGSIAFETGKEVNVLLEILQENNIEATQDQILRDISEINDVSAMDIYDLMIKE